MRGILCNSKLLVGFVVLLLLPLTINAGVTNISISPLNPTESSNIQALISGYISQSDRAFLNHKITIVGNSVTIDEYFFSQTGIGFLIVLPWGGDICTIGNLSAGDYTLTVNNYLLIDQSSPYPTPGIPANLDDYNIWMASHRSTLTESFTVVPEPMTLMLLGSGSLALLRRRRK